MILAELGPGGRGGSHRNASTAFWEGFDMQETADRKLLEALRRQGGMTVHECVRVAAVTPTAVRHRLNRLMAQGLVERTEEHYGRGRPRHSYRLTEQAQEVLGQNYADLAVTLWNELKTYEDRAVGMRVLRRVADRMAEQYRRQMPGQDVHERLVDLRKLLIDRGIDVEVDENGQLPVLRQHSCPYHGLAEVDRTVCGIELRMFEKALDSDLKLSQCRLDGHNCCEFEVRRSSPTPESAVLENISG
jgi:predicted ArsR family transcriptional regulator